MNVKFDELYECGEVLGSGAFAEVRKCKHRESGVERAVKIVSKETFASRTELREGSWIDEVNILKDLHHPGIVEIIDVFNSAQYLCIVMELMSGGDLFDAVVAAKRFPENRARDLFRKMCEALCYLHDKNIVHRDIKPENFLLDGENVKMADFGLAKFLGEKAVAQTLCGTPKYLAPEVIRFADSDSDSDSDSDNSESGYGKAVDVWSLGCVLFIMLAGYTPFNTRQDTLSGKYHLYPKRWNNVSQSAQDLIKKMLKVNSRDRITVQECLEHEWLNFS